MSDRRKLVVFTLCWIALVWFISWIGQGYFFVGGRTHAWSPLRFARQWDSLWYTGVAAGGYSWMKGEYNATAIYPLYPSFIHVLSFVIPFLSQDAALLLSGLVMSWISFIAGILIFYEWANHEFSRKQVLTAAFYLLLFPGSFFFATIYTESLYFLLTIVMFSFLRKNQWAGASIAGGLASLTRPIGVILIVPILFSIAAWKNQKGKIIKLCSSVAIFSLLFALFPFYLQLSGKNPAAPILDRQAWGVRLPLSFENITKNWERSKDIFLGLTHQGGYGFYLLALWIGSAVIGFLSSAWWFLKRRWAEGSYVAIGTLLPVFSGTFWGELRYVSILFPLFIWFAQIKYHNIHRAYLIVTPALLVVNITLFVNGLWVS